MINLYPSNDKIGPKQSNHHPSTNNLQHHLHQVPSLPIFRKNLLNSSRLRERLQIDGHKFFAKLPASGPETSKILHNIRRSRCIKWVKKFEFDPYLCDRSQINDLRKICYQIRDITWLNLVIRRVDFPQELATLSPFIARFSRLKSIRVEFPRTENIDENSLIQLYKAIGNCSRLISHEWKAIEMPERSARLVRAAHNSLQCLRSLKSIKVYTTLRKGALKNNFGAPGKFEKQLKHRNIDIKVLDMTFASTGEWANKEITDQSKQMEGSKMFAKMILGLEKATFRAIKTPTNFEDIIKFFTIVAFVPTLHHVESQYLNCQITDMEVIAFAHGLTKAKHIKYFSLKVIQKPGLSEDCIEQLARGLSKLENLTKFDLYFRRLGLHPQSIKELGDRIEHFGNIRCCCSKESIHIYRRSDSE